METTQSAGMDAKKNAIESMTKEELLSKYKGLLGIAKQAKKAKDEFAEENHRLKDQLINCETQREADKNSLLTMKEMLEEFTRNKLTMTSELTELRNRHKCLAEERTSIRNDVEKLSIENEALRRQLNRLTEDNESLLTDIDQMEQQLKQVNVLGIEQKKHLHLLELEVEKLKEYEVTSRNLETKLQELIEANKSLEESYNISQTESQSLAAKYQSLKEINSEQRTNFNGLKERFIEVHKKLKQLQECKRVLVESHHEYADSISRWQLEIMHASEQLCGHIQTLSKENTELKRDSKTVNADESIALPQLPALIEYCEKALVEYRRQNEVIDELRKENDELKKELESRTEAGDEVDHAMKNKEEIEALRRTNDSLMEKIAQTQLRSDEELKLLRTENESSKEVEEVERLREENENLKEEVANADEDVQMLIAENAKLVEEASKSKLIADEVVNLLRRENAKLEEEVNVKLETNEEVQFLRTENLKLKEETSLSADEVVTLRTQNATLQKEAADAKLTAIQEVAKNKLYAEEGAKQLMLQNARLEEELAKTKLGSDEEVKQLRTDILSLKEEAAKMKLHADEEIKQLNTRLEEEVAKIKVTSDEQVKQLQASFDEQVAKIQLSSDQESSLLKKKNESLEEELSTIRHHADEEIKQLQVRLDEEIARIQHSSREEVNRLRAEKESLEKEAANAKLSLDEKIMLLTEKNEHLEKEAADNKLNAEEEVKILKAKLAEEAAKVQYSSDEEVKKNLNREADEEVEQQQASLVVDEKPNSDEEIKVLRLNNESLKEEVKLLKEKRTEKDAASISITTVEETNHLRTENHKLEKEATVLRQNAAELQKSNQELKNELQMIDNLVASRLPVLIECCGKAIQEHQQQAQLLVALRNENIFKTEESIRKTNATLSEDVAKTKLYTETQASFNKELDTLKSENTRLRQEQSKDKQNEFHDVLSLRDNLLSTTQYCEDLQTKLEKQERENTDLLNEMRELNEALKGRGDVISKQQAKHQELVTEIKKTSNALAKVEAYLTAKEKIIKEKEQKIAKMSEDNHSALQEVHRLQNLSRENDSRIKSLSDEIVLMRSQYENHDTQSEVLSTSTISRAEELARLREVDESFEEKYNKLRSLAVKLKKKAHEQSLCIADLEKQSVDSKAKATETGERITSLESERESLQNELKSCKNQIETLKAEVDKLKASKKQSNVLTLEIEAFEKSLNDTSAKLSAKISEYDLLRETLYSKEASIEVMKKEIKILEDSKESEKVHSVELKKQIDKLQAQLKDVIHAKQEVCVKLEESQSEKQALQSDLDEINQRLGSISDERDAEREIWLKEKENLLQTMNSLEGELNTSNNRIKLAERSFQDLNQEYSNYKVKAQSVLRQNQTKESSKERELEEELTLIKGEHKDLCNRLKTFQEKFQTTEKTIEELQEENRCLQNRNSELMKTISDLRQNAEFLSQENRKQLETYQDTLKGHRLQIEALDSCHIEQMQDLQSRYDRQIAELKMIHKKDSEVVFQKPLEKHDYILMEREDAEGSEAEATHTPKYLPSAKRSTHDLVPLDELLSSPTVDSTYTVLERRQSISPSVELQETKDRLNKQESRVRHLTSLLAESEQDLARLTQLNEMLKEEVRRQERTVEREKHMHNSEYLKNVVLKFVSLNNGDERTRLVPVLNTILKLSPTETEMLQNVAKGKAADNNNRTWGSFLPNWGTS